MNVQTVRFAVATTAFAVVTATALQNRANKRRAAKDAKLVTAMEASWDDFIETALRTSEPTN